jgi:transposase
VNIFWLGNRLIKRDNLDYKFRVFQIQQLYQLVLKRHLLVGIDLGTKTHASMVVLNGSLAANENETICKGKWIEKLFAKNRTKQRYYRSIANRILSQSHAIAPEKTGAYIVDWKTYLCIIHERT